MGLEERLPDDGFVTTTLEAAVNWGRKYSIFPLTFGLACCAIESISSGASRFDISRFGSEVFRGSPRQADLMIVSGRVSNKMAPVVKRLYDQMLEPKWVIAMGICASTGGPFNNYRSSRASTSSSLWMCTFPVARHGPRRCFTQSHSCRRKSRVEVRDRAYGRMTKDQ